MVREELLTHWAAAEPVHRAEMCVGIAGIGWAALAGGAGGWGVSDPEDPVLCELCRASADLLRQLGCAFPVWGIKLINTGRAMARVDHNSEITKKLSLMRFFSPWKNYIFVQRPQNSFWLRTPAGFIGGYLCYTLALLQNPWTCYVCQFCCCSSRTLPHWGICVWGGTEEQLFGKPGFSNFCQVDTGKRKKAENGNGGRPTAVGGTHQGCSWSRQDGEQQLCLTQCLCRRNERQFSKIRAWPGRNQTSELYFALLSSWEGTGCGFAAQHRTATGLISLAITVRGWMGQNQMF